MASAQKWKRPGGYPGIAAGVLGYVICGKTVAYIVEEE